MKTSFIESYLRKHAFCPPQLNINPDPEVDIIVVIPSYKEPDLPAALNSLRKCSKISGSTEVIIVINAPENSSAEVVSQNENSFNLSMRWIKEHEDPELRFFIIMNNYLPLKHAGVGLARKIGMDEAAYRFSLIGKSTGIIVCFDADSTCEENYLVEIKNHFDKNPSTPGCSIYFEHLLNDQNPGINEGILQYELFLRYYRQGLKFAGHPFAFHTVGSSMAVRADAYCKQGGMNKRKAGEDFYFLQKIIPIGNFSEIIKTRVIPSSRPSDRVPFGTGKAITDFLHLNSRDIYTYHPQTFDGLKKLCDAVRDLYDENNSARIIQDLPAPVKSFLMKNHFSEIVKEIRGNTANRAMFIKRFYSWFDGFLALKFTHYMRDEYYGEMPVLKAASEFLTMIDPNFDRGNRTPVELLNCYRQLDRKNYSKE